MTTAPGLPAWSGRYATRLTAACLAEYGTQCHLCLLDGATTADHLVPRTLGGLDHLENLRPAHAVCNSSRQRRALTPVLVASFRTDAWHRRVLTSLGRGVRVDGRASFVSWS